MLSWNPANLALLASLLRVSAENQDIWGNGMTAISNSGGLTQQLYMRLFDRLDADRDEAISGSEVAASDLGQSESASLVKKLDADRDGSISRAEMTPSRTFGAETMGSLIAAQSDSERATMSEEIIADLFKRADLDGDGALSDEERKAEGDLRRASNLDAGYSSDIIFVAWDKNRDGSLTKDEFGVGVHMDPGKLRFFDEMPEGVQQRLQADRENKGLPPIVTLNDTEKAERRAQLDADRAERASGPPGTMKILNRDFARMREQAAAAYGAGAELSDSLSQRLLGQIMGERWTTDAKA